MDIEWALFTVAGEAETTKGDGGDNMDEEQIVEAFCTCCFAIVFRVSAFNCYSLPCSLLITAVNSASVFGAFGHIAPR